MLLSYREGVAEIWTGPPGALLPVAKATAPRPRQTVRVHPAGLGMTALAPDGMTAATSGDGVIRVWDLAKWDKVTGQGCQLLTGPRGEVTRLHFAESGNTLAVALADGCVVLWDVARGEQIQTFLHGSAVRFLSCDREGKLLATCGNDMAAVWDVGTGKVRWRFHEGAEMANAMALSPDGSLLALGASVKVPGDSKWTAQVKVWNVATGQLVHTFGNLDGPGYPLAFSADSKLLAAVSGADGTISLWETATGKRLQALRDGSELLCLAFSPNGKLLATGGCLPGWISLWDVDRGEHVTFLAHGQGCVTNLRFSADGQTLVSIGSPSTIKLWEVAELLRR
jgi:WD40 repeat protein